MKIVITIVFLLVFFAKDAFCKIDHEINIKYDPLHNTVPVVNMIIDNNEYDIIVDTGSPDTITLNTQFFKSKPKKISLIDINKQLIDIPIQESVGRNFPFTEKGANQKIYGILGFKFLSRYDFSLSLFRKKITLFTKDRVSISKKIQMISINEDPNIPFLPICYDGENTLHFLLDTGASTCNIRESDIKSNKNLRFDFDISDSEFDSMSRFGKIRLGKGIFNNFYINDKIFPNVETSISKNNTFVNIIGNNVLRRFTIEYFKKNKEFLLDEIKITDNNYTNPLGELGFSIERRTNGFYINGITAVSSAEKAGLLKNDNIISINEKAISSFEDYELKNINYKPLEMVFNIKYMRDSKINNVSIIPSDVYTSQDSYGYGAMFVLSEGNLMVLSVLENSSAHRKGIAYGDIIYSANGVMFTRENFSDFSKEMAKGKVLLKLKQADSGNTLSVYIEKMSLDLVPWVTRKRLSLPTTIPQR